MFHLTLLQENKMIKTIYILILIVYLGLSHSPALSSKLKKVHIGSKSGEKITAYMLRPKRKGRYPAIIALHGCSGLLRKNRTLTSRHEKWAKLFVKWGYVVLFPDSYSSRGTGSQCKMYNRSIRQTHRIADAKNARNWLLKQRFIQKKNISVLGWSYGGSAVLRLVYSKHGKGFKHAIAFYPGCADVYKKNKTRARLPLTILVGKKDDWTPPEPCQKLVKKWGGKIKIYQRAHHGFDIPNFPVRTKLWVSYSKRGDGVVHVGTNTKAKNEAIIDVGLILRK